MPDVILDVALIGGLGMAAQWIAWRFQIPAIVILLVVGFIAGPVTGALDPEATFGDLLSPLVSIAVAIILFEGGLNLNFSEITGLSASVRRLIVFGAPATWGLTYLAAHHIGGLSAPTAAVISGVLVVTGPTVIMPLLRQTRLPRGASSLLRWEGIVADPIGAMFAVIAYEGAVALSQGEGLSETVLRLGVAIFIGGSIAIILSRTILLAFIRGLVPEFLKAPILLVAVLLGFGLTNLFMDEAGLLTVTAMGIALANTRMASLEELRRFKEMITILLVSGLFIVLIASMQLSDLLALGWRDFLFLGAMLFLIRPAVVMAATAGGKLSWRERLLCSWIAPRGVVAVAVSGLFAQAMAAQGFEDAGRMAPIAFLVVVATVVLHGFSIRPLSLALGISSAEPPGILLVGGSAWTTALGVKLKEAEMPVLIADGNWNRLAAARREGLPYYYGEILSEAAEHRVDVSRYGALIAATDDDSYNALVCTDLGPEMGRSNVFQLGRQRTQHDGEGAANRAERHQLHFTVGGRTLFRDGSGYHQLDRLLAQGWVFHRTRLSKEFDYEAFKASRAPEFKLVFVQRPNGRLVFSTTAEQVKPVAGDVIFSFGPPLKEDKTNGAKEKAESAGGKDT